MDPKVIEILTQIGQALILIFFIILPILVLLLLESLDLKPFITKYFKMFLFLFLPLLLILIGITVGIYKVDINILHLTASWFYIISIIWFGMGIIFYSAMDESEKN